MNIKFSDNALNLKITEAELERLNAGESVATEGTIADRRLAFRIIPASGLDAIQSDYSADEDETVLEFYTPANDIATLAAMGRSKHGLCLQESDPEITLQVDIRADTREKTVKLQNATNKRDKT